MVYFQLASFVALPESVFLSTKHVREMFEPVTSEWNLCVHILELSTY